MAKASADKNDAGRAFFRRLADGPLAMVYVITGEERFLVDEAMRRITERVFPEGKDDLNFATFHGSEASGITIASAAAQVPMFADRRLVLVRGVDAMRADELAPVATYAESAFDSTVLVLEAVRLDARLGAVKRLLAARAVDSVDLVRLDDRDAASWCRRQATRRGLEIDGDVAAHLVAALGADLALLDHALQRLELFVGARQHATLSDAEAVVPDTRARTVFSLADALAARRLDVALGLLDRLLDQGENPVGALAFLATHFRRIATVRLAMDANMSEQECASELGLTAWKVRSLRETARRFSAADLADIAHALAETDHALKSSRVRRELIVERLFMRICSAHA